MGSVDWSFGGATVLVTGSTRGIGEGVARRFAAAGASVVVTGRSADDAEAVASAIRDGGDEALAVGCDVRDPDDVASLVEAGVERYGGIDVLVNNAAMETDDTAADCDVATWDAVVDTNLRGYWLVARACRPHLTASPYGAVVNIGSNHAGQTHPGKFPYNVTKSAIEGLTRALALEWAPEIRVNGVAPGWIEVDRTAAAIDEDRDHLEEIHPVGRVGRPDDVADAVLYLASDAASFVAAETLVVDGGRAALLQDDLLDFPVDD